MDEFRDFESSILWNDSKDFLKKMHDFFLELINSDCQGVRITIQEKSDKKNDFGDN